MTRRQPTTSDSPRLRFGAVVGVAALAGFLGGCGRPDPSSPQKNADVEIRFTALEGWVQLKKAGAPEWTDATLAVTLRKNDLIHTGPDGSAEILFPDGTRLSVIPNSTFTIPELDAGGHPHLKPMRGGTFAGGTPGQKPAESAPPQPPAMDHSHHHPDKAPAKEEPMDHSKHKMEEE